SSPNLAAPGDNFLFSSTYTTTSWDGELIRRQLDPFNASVSSIVDWAAQAKLDAKTPSTRTIYAFDSGAGNKLKTFSAANFGSNVNFNTPKLSTAPEGLTQFLCSSPTVCLNAAAQAAAAGNN